MFSAPGTPSGKTTQDTRHMNTESTQPVLTAEGKPYIWGDDSFATLPQTEGAIAMYLADHLCNGDIGAVIHGYKIHAMEVRVYLLDEGGNRINDPEKEVKAKLLAALKTALDWTEGDLDCPEVLDKQTIVERIKFIKSAIARAAIKAAKGVQS